MSDILELEQGIRDAKVLISRRQAAMKLSENPEFRDLFMNGYFETEAARMVQLSGDPSLDVQQRADALAMAQATGHAKRYLSATIQMGYVAERELPDLEAELELARAEEGAE